MIQEKWKPINGYEDTYEVSNLGNVKSLNYMHTKRPHLLSPAKSNGYLWVILCTDGRIKFHSVHRLVADAFCLNPENKSDVNHKNGIKTDNVWTNVEWNTKSENTIHAIKNGLFPSSKGEKNGMSKLTEQQVFEIRQKFIPWKYSQSKLAKEYGMSQQQISSIITHRTWG